MTSLSGKAILVTVFAAVIAAVIAVWIPGSGATRLVVVGAVGLLTGGVAGVIAAAAIRQRMSAVVVQVDQTMQREFQMPVDFRASDELDKLNDFVDKARELVHDLKQEIHERTDETRTLVALSGAINADLTPSRVLPMVLTEAMKHVRAQQGVLYLLSDDAQELVIRACRGENLRSGVGSRIPVDSGIAGHVVRTRRPLILRKGLRDPGMYRLFGPLDCDVICVPLRVQDRIIGALELSSKDGTDSFTHTDRELLTFMANSASIVIENANQQRARMALFFETVNGLARAVDAKDPYTRFHSARVAAYATAMGRVIGYSPDEMDGLQFGATLHDVGKIAIPESILNKPGRLTEEEFEVMKTHTVEGEKILQHISFPWPVAVLPIVRCHHERYDGRGYPDGLVKDEIDFNARLLAICDTFDAMTTDRPYRKGMEIDHAFLEIQRGAGSQFDPDLVQVFMDAFKREGEVILATYDRYPETSFEDTMQGKLRFVRETSPIAIAAGS